jgi:2-oxo-3-hexenedioate decarboxylase/2-keto-4-pentenoate hydratase
MAESTRVASAAEFLFKAHEDHDPFDNLPAAIAPRSLDEVYEIHDRLAALWADAKGTRAGYKIAFTTPVMQQIAGFDQPAYGPILARTVHNSRVVLHASGYEHLGIECEIAFRFGRGLVAQDAPYSREAVADAVASAMPAFELVEDRHADISKIASQILSACADFVWNAGAVLGVPNGNWRTLDLAEVRGTLAINNEIVGQGSGSDVLGHPLDALTWLVNSLAERNRSIQAGDFVLTGSIVALRFLNAGDSATFSLDGLGDVQLTVQ